MSAHNPRRLDGLERPEYKDFVPSAASIELLDRFYRIRVRDSEPAAILLDALKLYSDLDACRHIDELDERLRIIDPNDPKTKELHKLREAWLKIQNEIFKPKT